MKSLASFAFTFLFVAAVSVIVWATAPHAPPFPEFAEQELPPPVAAAPVEPIKPERKPFLSSRAADLKPPVEEFEPSPQGGCQTGNCPRPGFLFRR